MKIEKSYSYLLRALSCSLYCIQRWKPGGGKEVYKFPLPHLNTSAQKWNMVHPSEIVPKTNFCQLNNLNMIVSTWNFRSVNNELCLNSDQRCSLCWNGILPKSSLAYNLVKTQNLQLALKMSITIPFNGLNIKFSQKWKTLFQALPLVWSVQEKFTLIFYYCSLTLLWLVSIWYGPPAWKS